MRIFTTKKANGYEDTDINARAVEAEARSKSTSDLIVMLQQARREEGTKSGGKQRVEILQSELKSRNHAFGDWETPQVSAF